MKTYLNLNITAALLRVVEINILNTKYVYVLNIRYLFLYLFINGTTFEYFHGCKAGLGIRNVFAYLYIYTFRK